jgi:simple sugar transport system ATP-binding protein
MTAPILELRAATKRYAGVPAIDGIDFDLARGEIHAILGENGAGKSTLTKVMAGVVGLTSGRMFIEGKEVQPQTPNQAHKLGIAMVFQETSLVPTMTVAQNLFLGNEPYFNRLRGIYIEAQQFLQSLQFDVDPTTVVSLLGAAKKQMVEIARADARRKAALFSSRRTTQVACRFRYIYFPRSGGSPQHFGPHNSSS